MFVSGRVCLVFAMLLEVFQSIFNMLGGLVGQFLLGERLLQETSKRGSCQALLRSPKGTNYHGPPKPTFLEAFMVDNLVFRWPKPLFFMVLGAHGTLCSRPGSRHGGLCPLGFSRDTCASLACQHPQTGAYDFYRHIYLRQSFVAVYVTEQKAVIDCHRDFIAFGGWIEHSLFVQGLVEENDFLSPICPELKLGSGRVEWSELDSNASSHHSWCRIVRGLGSNSNPGNDHLGGARRPNSKPFSI